MKKFIQLVYLVDCETNNGILFTWNQLSRYHLQTPQAPIVCIATYETYRIHDSPLGTNAIVAVLAYSRYDMEDAMSKILDAQYRTKLKGFSLSSFSFSHFLQERESSFPNLSFSPSIPTENPIFHRHQDLFES
ncbi:hypothetical protein L2E82_03398 [Cichorium intybus]|uniref:Uncharacterized protein n=1 Tax=Cichorium intybus TaxID=13427 RepID=A0ACB9H3T5_CICIN|nr:hypothetical protein L2E82_03398 [Cichorium intybus]